MAKGKFWYIGERNNPQFKQPYYKVLGNITKSEAEKYVQTIYGSNSVFSFNTEAEMLAKVTELKNAGYRVLN